MHALRILHLAATATLAVLVHAQIVQVKDFGPSTLYDFPKDLVASGDLLFFEAYEPATGWELWKSDGTTAGTTLVKDINPGANNSVFFGNWLTDVNGTLFFMADDGVHGRELWKSDGTEGGTVMVKDINPGSAESIPSFLVNFNGILLFEADNGESVGRTIHTSDGTEAGTTPAFNSTMNINGARPIVIGNTAYFTAYTTITNSYALWKTNGTAPTTQLLADIRPGPISAFIFDLTPLGDGFYFTADNGLDGNELWYSGGVPGNTTMVADLMPGAGGSSPHFLTVLNGQLYFSASDPTHIRSIWRLSGGTPTLVSSEMLYFSSGTTTSYMSATDELLYFMVNSPATGLEVWTSDGTIAGTGLLRDIAPGTDNGAGEITLFHPVGNDMFFSAYTPATGYELWRSDGTESGTQLVQDRNIPFGASFIPSELTTVGDGLFMRGTTYANSKELYRLGLNAPTGIAERADRFELQAWPNPTMGEVSMLGAADVDLRNARFELRDVLGRRMPGTIRTGRTGSMTTLQLPVECPAGTYLLHVWMSTGEHSTLRLIKQ